MGQRGRQGADKGRPAVGGAGSGGCLAVGSTEGERSQVRAAGVNPSRGRGWAYSRSTGRWYGESVQAMRSEMQEWGHVGAEKD